MVGRGTRSTIERVEIGNSRPKAARASALPDGGLAHEPGGAMQVGEPLLTWSGAITTSAGTPGSCTGALGTWQLQESPDTVGPANHEAPVEANHTASGRM